MLIDIHGVSYSVKTKWEEITIEETIELAEIEQPKELTKMLEIITTEGSAGYFKKYKSLAPKAKNKTLPLFFKEMFLVLSDVPFDVAEKLSPREFTAFYNDWFITLHLDMMLMSVMDVDNKLFFEFEGVKYYYPKIGKFINGTEKYGVDMMAMQFTESADLMINTDQLKGGDIGALPFIIALLCRPAEDLGKNYDELVIQDRADKFKTLTMDVAWEVYFFIRYCLQVFEPFIPISIKGEEAVLQPQEPQKKAE